MTIVLTWWSVLEFVFWLLATAFGVYMLSRCFAALRSYRHKKQRDGVRGE